MRPHLTERTHLNRYYVAAAQCLHNPLGGRRGSCGAAVNLITGLEGKKMERLISRSFSLAALVSFATVALAMAQDSSTRGTAQGSSTQQSASAQSSTEAKSEQGTTQSNQQSQIQSSSNSASSGSTQQQGTPQKQNDNQNSGTANSSQLQTQNHQSKQDATNRNSSTQERSDARNVQTNRQDVDDRSSQTQQRSSREQEASRENNMRGPDIGLWFSRNSRDGLVIADVSSKGAIARFGFHEGDRIVSVNGHRVTTEAEFIQFVLHSDVDQVKIIVIRDGREEVIVVEPQVLTREYDVEYTQTDPLERFGIIVDDRYDDRIVVWRVIPRSPAYYAGFRPGDVVVNFGGRPYKTRTEFEHGAGEWKEGEVNVEIRRGDKTRQLSADVPRNERSNVRTAERTDRQMDRQDRRSERASGRRGPGILNRGR
jgi:C-terminal processing protease CtpA/Prc